MDLRDNIHDQLEEHIRTLRVLAALETPPQLLWEECQRILRESATHLELHMLPKVDAKAPYLDLRTGKIGAPLKVAEYVGATSADDIPAAEGEPNAFLGAGLPSRPRNGASVIN